jgi:hypothetical protein
MTHAQADLANYLRHFTLWQSPATLPFASHVDDIDLTTEWAVLLGTLSLLHVRTLSLSLLAISLLKEAKRLLRRRMMA